MAKKSGSKTDIVYDPVDTYDERPFGEAVRSPEETARVQPRPTEDQDADYHQRFKTLQADDLPDLDEVRELRDKAAATITKKEAKQRVEDNPEQYDAGVEGEKK